MNAPRNSPNADKPGAYNLATRVGKTVINPGDALKIEQYITGYGNITQVKLVCYLSSDIFDVDHTYVEYGMKPDSTTGEINWGKHKSQLEDPGLTLGLVGFRKDGWAESTMILDVDGASNRVLTELKLEKAPLDYNLKTLKTISPGDHYIDFYLTYFNGEKWCVTKEKTSFKVKNFFERHAKKISWLAVIATTLSIIRFGLVPAINLIRPFL
ncbi:hypothetical protein D3C86_1370620 [compost metagenome]